MQIDLIVSMNKLITIWVALILVPPIVLFSCIAFPCFVFIIIYDQYFDGHITEELSLCWRYREFFKFLLTERAPKISSKEIHPFKLRSPFSVSKHYKSPENFIKIIEKPSLEVCDNIIGTNINIILVHYR